MVTTATADTADLLGFDTPPTGTACTAAAAPIDATPTSTTVTAANDNAAATNQPEAVVDLLLGDGFSTADQLGADLLPPPPPPPPTSSSSNDIKQDVPLLLEGLTVSGAENHAAHGSPTTVTSTSVVNAIDLLSGAPEPSNLFREGDYEEEGGEGGKRVEISESEEQGVANDDDDRDSNAKYATAGDNNDDVNVNGTSTNNGIDCAPALPGMKKIVRTTTNGGGTSTTAEAERAKRNQSRRPRVIVPHRSIGMGLDLKFEEDPSKTNLCNLLAPHEYRTAVATVNDALRTVRATSVDKALMATSPLVVPLAVLGKRQGKRGREKRMVLHEAILSFNEEYPTLRMMWVKGGPVGDYLCIVERDDGTEDVVIAVNRQLPTGLE